MRLLLDQNISFKAVKKLREYFPQIQSVKENKLENADDLKIWQYARDNQFTVVTFDEDFYNIQSLKEFPPKIIWFKTGNLDKNQFVDFLITKKDIIKAFIENEEYIAEGCLEFFLIKK
jgi:predicted nuclease of predicted toxin-antitoxin system